MNGEKLYLQLRTGQIDKSQLSDKQLGEVYRYMVDSKRISSNDLKPAVAEKYNIGTNKTPIKQEPFNITDYVDIPKQTYTPSRSPDTNAPIITPTYTPTHIPSRSPDTNAINYQPPKSTTPEMELVDILSNITMPKRQQGSPLVKKPMGDNEMTLGNRIIEGVKGIGYNWAGGNLNTIGTIASIGSDYEVNHRPESSYIAPKDFFPNNPDYKDNRITETQQTADKFLHKGAEHTAKGREGLGTIGGVAYDILTGAGQMAADIGTAALTGAGMLPVLGFRVFGQGSSEARQEGADIGQQIAYGAISAGIEIAAEKLVGGLPMAEKLGMGGVADEAMENVAIKLAKMIKGSPRVAKAFVYLANMLGEGAEEMISEILSPFAKRLTYEPNADLAQMEEILYSGLLGAGISGVMGGGVVGNPTVDFNIAESYNPTPKHQFDINNYQFKPQDNTPVQPQQEQIYPYELNIEGLQNTISQGLNQLYNQLLNVGTDNTQAIDRMIDTLKRTAQEVPELSDFVNGHINTLNAFRTLKQPQTNETNKVEQSIEQDTNVAQIERNDVIDGTEQAVDDNKTIDNIIPIDELRQKEISQDSNNIVTETQQLDNVTNVTENIGYHAGDLGKADYLNNMPGRGTGHFGTGTYFIGNEQNITDDYKKRPIHTVSFEGYNLYKPKTAEEGRNLHSFLKKINDISLKEGYIDIIDDILKGKVDAEYIENLIANKFPYNGDFDINIDYSDITETDDIEKMLSQIDEKMSQVNIPPEVTERKNNIESYLKSLDKLIDNIEEVKSELKNKFNFSDEKINKTIKELYQYGTSNLKSNKMDSPSTVFMKSLGYEGVDVRGLKGLDNTEYGSVIYDLKTEQNTQPTTETQTIEQSTAQEQAIEQPTTQEPAQSEQATDKYNGFKVNDKVRFTDRNGKELTGTIKRFDDYSNISKSLGIVADVDVDQVATYGGGVPIGRREIVSINQLRPYETQETKPQENQSDIQKKNEQDYPAGTELYNPRGTRWTIKAWNGDKATLVNDDGIDIVYDRETVDHRFKTKAEWAKGNIKPILDFLKNKLDNNEKMQPSELYSLANDYFGGLQTSGAYKTKDAYEILELALNMYLIENVKLTSSTSKDKLVAMLDKINNILSNIPTQTKRSDEQIAKQQFSTPPNISLIAGWLAKISETDHVLEPSAGNGGLALWGITANAEVTVNEIDQQRMNNLKQLDFDNYFMENAEQLDRILPDNIKPTVVIMNPPFSTALNMDKKNSDNVKKHIGQALDRLQDNGRAVIIAGNTLAEGKPKFSGWWSEIKGKYNVKANITIDGENYRKYGTTFDIQLIVIDKNGPTQDKTITGSFKNLEDVINILEGVRNERPEIRNNQGISGSEQSANKPSGIKDDAEIRPTMGTGIRNDSNSTSGDGSIGNRGGMADTTGKGNNQGNNADGNDRGIIQQTGNNKLSETGNRSDIERGGAEDSGRRDTSDEVIGGDERLSDKQHGSDTDGVKDTVKVKNKKSEKVNIDLDENRVFEIYRPEKLDIKDAQPHPAELVESAAMSAVSPPDITYSPVIPNDIIKKGLLSDAQMEVVVYAGQAHSQKLPNGTTKGYYIGDGTGVGKGREIAGIIYDNYLQGRKKAVWITKNTDLIKDAKRDVEGIGWKDGNVISGIKRGAKIKDKEGILVTTYGTISDNYKKEVIKRGDDYTLAKDNRIQQIYEWLGKDFDGVIAFDEAHKMKSGLSVQGTRGKSKPSDTALAGIALQELFPKAKIVYVSATNAVNIEDLAYAQRLGLWGEGTAFPTVEAFVSEISKGGVAAMELVSRDMKSMGLYTARNISFNGVSYERLEHKLTNEQRVVYNKIAEAWQIILNNVRAAVEETQVKGKSKGQAYSAFWSNNQRFFNQILTSMQMPIVIEDIKKQLAEGKSVVLQIVSTNEASLKRKIAEAVEEGLTPDEMDLTPRELLINYLEKSFPVQQFEDVADDSGNLHSVPVTDSQGNPVLNKEAVRMRDEMIADIQDMPIPDDILTIMFDEFGGDQIAEITGRKRRVVTKINEKTGISERVVEKISKKAGAAEEAAFMNGDKRILIFSKAGGTGRSYHASKDAKNQQQRVHYLVEAGYSAMDAVQGFGRTHRSNESSAPLYKLVSTDLSGQKRFLSTIARRLGQLGAMTKGQRQAGGGMFTEKDNLEGPLAGDALYNLYQDINNGVIEHLHRTETFQILGLEKVLDEYGNLNEKSDDLRKIPKFLNRILSLPVDLQNSIFAEFEKRLDMAMDYAMQNGTLDVGLEVLKGESIDIESKKLLRENKDLNTKTELVKLKVGEKVKKTKFDKLPKDRLIGYYMNERSGSVRAVYSMGTTTKASGSIVERIRLVGQAQHQNLIQDMDTLKGYRSNWVEISEAEAKTLWEEAYNDVSDIKYSTVNMVTGTLLPIWDKLPSDKTRVMRTITNDGEQLLGRILNEKQLEIFMQRMGMNIDKEKYTVKKLYDEVFKNGKTAHIDNGWKIKSSRVNNEKRLEIIGDLFFYKDRFEKLGLYREIINSKSRWFIPVNSNTMDILNELLKYNEIIKIVDETSGTQFSKGVRGYSGNGSTTIDMSRPLKKPTEIKKDITKKFKVPISSKKFYKRKTVGFYKNFPEVIRTKYENDIGTIMHELGHHLDKKYNFSKINPKLIQDMIDKLDDAFRNAYKKHELPGEVVAEFLHYYSTDTQAARDFAGDFYELFEQTLSKEDLKNIQEIRNDVLRWVNAERAEKRQSTIVPLSQKKKVSERISETIKFEKANSVLFDRYAPIQEFVKTVEKLTGRKLPASLNPYMLVERTYKNNARIEGIIKGQLTDTEYNPLDTDDSLQKIVDDVKRDVTPFEDYLKLKHAITLAEKNHMIYSPDVYNNVEDMRQDLEFIEQQYPQFIELSERLYDWYDKFFKAWVVDTNMLGEDSKKIYTKMRQEYPYYVPMFRVREDGSSKQASGSLTDQKTPVDRLSEKGSDKDTISPIDNIITQVSRIVNAYSKNNVMRAIVENYNTVDGLGGFIDRVPPDMEKQILSTQSIKDSLETEFEDVENIDDIINSIPDLIENYKPLTKSKDKEIVGVITKSGKRQFYQVFDKAFLNSLTNMNPTQLDATVRMIASVRRTTTALTTGLNPIFGIVSNAPRDFTQAYIFGSYKNPAEYVYEYVKALTSVIRRNDNYKLFRDIGGVYGSSMTTELRTKNDFIRRLTKYRKGQKIRARNALSYIGELILDFNDAIETAPRLAEFNKAYKIAKNRGDSDYDATLYALSRADDVTLNFSRRGEIMNTAVGQSIPYLNAGLQGMDKLRRGLFTGEERTQTLIKSITMLTIPTILLWLAHRDDEDYEKLTKGIKDNYWILWKNPDGSFVRIPKPKDLAGIFSADFERALNAYFKEEGAGAFEGFQSTIADSLLPPVDTVFRPLIDVIGNKKWSGGKIVPMAMEYLPKTEQYDETTSRIAVELAQLIGKVAPDSNFASPKNVDYILDQYYGGLADILLPMTTPTTYVNADTLKDKYNYLAMPMAAIMKTGELIGRKFKADPSYSNNVVNDFYDLRDKTIKANNAYKNRKVMSDNVDLIAENQFKAYYKSISSMWKTIDYIDSLVNKTLPDGHKESYEKLINQSRFADSTKQKVLDDLKDNKLNRESITMLQKTIRDEIVKLADKAVKEYKANHKENNEMLR